MVLLTSRRRPAPRSSSVDCPGKPAYMGDNFNTSRRRTLKGPAFTGEGEGEGRTVNFANLNCFRKKNTKKPTTQPTSGGPSSPSPLPVEEGPPGLDPGSGARPEGRGRGPGPRPDLPALPGLRPAGVRGRGRRGGRGGGQDVREGGGGRGGGGGRRRRHAGVLRLQEGGEAEAKGEMQDLQMMLVTVLLMMLSLWLLCLLAALAAVVLGTTRCCRRRCCCCCCCCCCCWNL